MGIVASSQEDGMRRIIFLNAEGQKICAGRIELELDKLGSNLLLHTILTRPNMV